MIKLKDKNIRVSGWAHKVFAREALRRNTKIKPLLEELAKAI